MGRVYALSVARLAAVMVLGAAPTWSQSPSPGRESPPLRLVQEIPLPGVEGRLDHFTVDPKRKRVIVSALASCSNCCPVRRLFFW
jgi:hypothetical protein